MKKTTGLLTLLLLLMAFCHDSLAIKVKSGSWITRLELQKEVLLPVRFEISKGKNPDIYIMNGYESIHLIAIQKAHDSLLVLFNTFDSELRIHVSSKTELTGSWYNRAKSPTYHIDFTSVYSSSDPYPVESKQLDVEGKWEVTFDYQNEPEKAIGIFNYPIQSEVINNYLHGTFLTETGDYRYLEGATIGDSLFLSCFDGSHAFLFRAQLKNDTLWGDFHSGNHYKTVWFAVPNESFELRDPDSLTFLVNETPLEFELPSIDGSNYHYPNPQLSGKIVLIQIMGTWCPNCLDESNYLKTVYNRYNTSVEIIAVTFETQKKLEEKIEKVSKYKETLGLQYTFLIGGDACKPCASAIFPQLNDIMSFPTLIFIDKTGQIRKIHTGFSGPGTGLYYESFVQETDQFIEELIRE